MLKFLWAIILPLLPFWMPGEGVADVQTTLRVHLYCPSMPDLWEKTGEHLLKQLFNHVKEFTCMNICSHAVPFSLFHILLHAFTYFNVFSLGFTYFSYFQDFTSDLVISFTISTWQSVCTMYIAGRERPCWIKGYFVVFFILAKHAHSIIWFIGRKGNFCRCGTHYKS